MKHAYNVYPSHIAKILAHEAGLLSDMETDYWVGENEASLKMLDERDKLIEFQQMSLVASFEDALIVYHGMGLSEQQIKNLKIIYQVTLQLLPSTIFGGAMAAIASESRNKKPNMAVITNLFHTAIDQLTIKQRVAQ